MDVWMRVCVGVGGGMMVCGGRCDDGVCGERDIVVASSIYVYKLLELISRWVWPLSCVCKLASSPHP